jgi:hypothetical protein
LGNSSIGPGTIDLENMLRRVLSFLQGKRQSVLNIQADRFDKGCVLATIEEPTNDLCKPQRSGRQVTVLPVDD